MFYYAPSSISNHQGEIYAQVQSLALSSDGLEFTLKAPEVQYLEDFDVILIRQDPPFDMGYITNTYLLETLVDSVKVVNNPTAIRNFPEKILPRNLQSLMPPTLISKSIEEITEFARQFGDNIIIKPLYGNGGRGIFRVKPHDKNTPVIVESLTAIENLPVIAQAFIPEIAKGDKRIILIDGKPIGAINRIAPDHENRSNLHVGGTAHPSEITAQDQVICDTLKPFLTENSIALAGIDIIGKYLTEINITSPTGIQEISRFNKINPASMFWDSLNL